MGGKQVLRIKGLLLHVPRWNLQQMVTMMTMRTAKRTAADAPVVAPITRPEQSGQLIHIHVCRNIQIMKRQCGTKIYFYIGSIISNGLEIK